MANSLELITLRELLRDPTYRDYFKQIPELPPHYSPDTLPWKLLILKEGETAWRSKRYPTYRDAFDGLKKILPVSTNAAINCPALGFMPPIKNFKVKGKFVGSGTRRKPLIITKVWTPRIEADMESHSWCPHCRRPTIFRLATLKRPDKNGYAAVSGEAVDRCIICGASERIVDLRHPTNHQKWDENRPRVHVIR